MDRLVYWLLQWLYMIILLYMIIYADQVHIHCCQEAAPIAIIIIIIIIIMKAKIIAIDSLTFLTDLCVTNHTA